MHAAPALTRTLSTLPLDLIDTEPQIRMRNGFDKESIRQLADSIERNGLLQPILVAKVGERFRVIAGHRRVAAMRFIGYTTTPAVEATEADDERAFEAQLAENLHRENLNLADTADAVRMLSLIHERPADLARVVNKSPAWVSKHLSLTSRGFAPAIRELLDTRVCDDLETLLTLNQLAKHKAGRPALDALFPRLIAGDGVRADARAALAALKKPKAVEPAEDQAKQKEKFGKLELAEERAQMLLAGLEYAHKHKPSSRPDASLVAYVKDFIATTWPK